MKRQMRYTAALISIAMMFLLPSGGLSQGTVIKNKAKEEKKAAKRERKEKEKKAEQPERERIQDQVTKLRVEVAFGDPPKPVQSAEVFVKSEVEDSDFAETVTTDAQGVARLSEVPRGKVLIQVTSRGCKNFGKRYELTQESQSISITLEKLPDGGPSTGDDSEPPKL